MDITLSWDLFIIVFFALILAYSFIIGRKQTIKIIFSTYVSFIASDALGLFIDKTVGYKLPAKVFGFDPLMGAIVTKVLLFIFLIIVLTRHQTFDVGIEDGVSDMSYVATTGFVGFLSAVLMVSCMLFFISGDVISTFAGVKSMGILNEIKAQSELVEKILRLFHVWLFLPVVSLLTLSYLQKN